MRLNRNTWVVATFGDRRALRRRSEATDARSTSGLRLQKVALAFCTLAPASAAVFLPRALWSRPSFCALVNRENETDDSFGSRLTSSSNPSPLLSSSSPLFFSALFFFQAVVASAAF